MRASSLLLLTACDAGTTAPVDGFWQGWCAGEAEFTTTTGDAPTIATFHQLWLVEAPNGDLTGEVQQMVLIDTMGLAPFFYATLAGVRIEREVHLSTADVASVPHLGPILIDGRVGYDLRIRSDERLVGDEVVDVNVADYVVHCALCRADPAEAVPYPDYVAEAPVDTSCVAPLL